MDSISANWSEMTIPQFEQFGKLLEDGLLLVDYDQHILYANAQASTLLSQKLAHHKLNDIFNNAGFGDILRNIKTKKHQHEFIYTHDTSVKRQFLIKIIYISDHYCGILLMDMTLQRNLDKVRRDFVANVSHELRSPLTSLIGFIETLRSNDDIDEDSRSHFLSIMDEESRRMTRLIDDLISLSRVEVEEHIIPDEKVRLHDIVLSVLEILKDRASKQNVTLNFINEFTDSDNIAVIHGDADEVIEVIHNLVENALKYGYPNSVIDIRMSPMTNKVSCSVTNQGDGIEARHIPRLTERFYRVDKARSREKGGTGLGLAIVKHIVNRHRGELKIESKLGAETKFTVLFPIAGETSEPKRGLRWLSKS